MTFTEERYSTRIALGQKGNQLFMLVAICITCFVGFAFMKAMWYFRYPKELALPFFYNKVFAPFTLPADLNTFITKPWSVFSFMLAEDNVWRIFTHTLWCWCFGSVLQAAGHNKRIIPLFLYGSLGGALAFIVAFNLLPSLSTAMPYAYANGAGAGVMAIAVAATMVAPGYRFFPMIRGGIPLWILSIFYIAFTMLNSYNNIAAICLLAGGALAGALFVFFMQKGYDGSRWMNQLYNWFSNLFHPGKPPKGKNIKEELFYKSTGAPYTKKPNPTPQRIDFILDKINQQGFHSLTEEEKKLLQQAGDDEV
jgi:hypothetical protein